MPGTGRRDVVVLCYHALSEDWPAALSVTPGEFEAQIGLLASRGYRGVTFTEAVANPPPGKSLAVTFDDAYRSVRTMARPILERYEIPATVFVPTRHVDTERPMAWPGIDEWLGGPHEHELTPMSWQELRDLAHAGWEIGSHTCTHPRLSALSDVEIQQELVESRHDCTSMTGADCTSIAYPYGDYDARVARQAEQAGYSAAGALPSRLAQESRFAYPRIGVYHRDSSSSFRLKISPAMRRFRGSGLWLPVARLLRTIRRP